MNTKNDGFKGVKNVDYIDDRVIISDYIKNMTPEELRKAIEELEMELFGRTISKP